jgi:hypothetical protein
MITAEDALVRACNLPHDYHTRNMSPLALVAESGYREHRDAVDVEKIRAHLAAHPELIDQWLGFSGDKRVDRGWYFYAESENGPYTVGYQEYGYDKRVKRYSDRIEACAVYIQHELDSIGSHGTH